MKTDIQGMEKEMKKKDEYDEEEMKQMRADFKQMIREQEDTQKEKIPLSEVFHEMSHALSAVSHV